MYLVNFQRNCIFIFSLFFCSATFSAEKGNAIYDQTDQILDLSISLIEKAKAISKLDFACGVSPDKKSLLICKRAECKKQIFNRNLLRSFKYRPNPKDGEKGIEKINLINVFRGCPLKSEEFFPTSLSAVLAQGILDFEERKQIHEGSLDSLNDTKWTLYWKGQALNGKN